MEHQEKIDREHGPGPALIGLGCVLTVYSLGSLALVIYSMASAEPEKYLSTPLFIWLGALISILGIGWLFLRYWLLPEVKTSATRRRLLALAAYPAMVWLPVFGMWILLTDIIARTRTEATFRSALAEVKQIEFNKITQSVPAERAAVTGPGLVVIRTGEHGDSVIPLSGILETIRPRAVDPSEIKTMVVIYELHNLLAYVVIDWPKRQPVEWYALSDIPDRTTFQRVYHDNQYEYGHWVTVAGGPQWEVLLEHLRYQKEPAPGSVALLELYLVGCIVAIVSVAPRKPSVHL